MFEYWVEYHFIDTKWGRRPMYIKIFEDKRDAEEFAKRVNSEVIEGRNYGGLKNADTFT